MEKKYIEKRDSRNGKVYLTLLKSRKTQEKERGIIYQWVVENINQGEPNSYYASSDIYNKFLKDKNLDITKKSFGMYLQHILPRTRLIYNRVDKHSLKGMLCTYFGLVIKGVLPKTQQFFIKKRVGYNKFQDTNFTCFNKENLDSWVLNCLIINKELDKHRVESQMLLDKFCTYHNVNMDLNRKNLILWGRFLQKFLVKKYPFIKRLKKNIVVNGQKTTRNRYTCIKIKEELL